MKKILIVVDMQNDFITGTLGSEMAQAIVPNVINKIKNHDGPVIFTRDTHHENYLTTQEGKKLPIAHCIYNTEGWSINKEVYEASILTSCDRFRVNKNTFGYIDWDRMFIENEDLREMESVELIGLCTDICVVSNAIILKAMYPEMPITVDSSCCAGTTKESHEAALLTMKKCQIEVI